MQPVYAGAQVPENSISPIILACSKTTKTVTPPSENDKWGLSNHSKFEL